jgi:predicted nuclease of predicted toxin-antitoxin system
MRLKLDENLDERLLLVFEKAGHDASSVRLQGLKGETDESLFKLCGREDRVLVTLDLDFSNVLRFSPQDTPGIIVLRGRSNLLSSIRELVETLIAALKIRSPEEQLWIVEPGRLRIHASEGDDI